MLGSEHLDTLTTRSNLAFWTGRAGDAVGARDQYTELLPVQERVRGVDDPDTVSTGEALTYYTLLAEMKEQRRMNESSVDS
ncbi:tetratricopeptide repeat protein [Nonomuraea sp. NPDC055795]